MTKPRRILRTIVLGLALTAISTSIGCTAVSTSNSATTPPMGAMLASQEAPITICGETCVFEGRGENRGIGCATNIRGTLRVTSSAGITLASVDWTMNASAVVRPNETFLYDGCCFDAAVRNGSPSYQTEFRWDDVACPAS